MTLDTATKTQSIKEIVDILELNEKFMLCRSHCQKHEKTSHRLGGNTFKILIR